MDFIRGFHNLKPKHQGCVATLGNLDGLHLGHQALLAQLKSKAHELHLPSTVITFEPLPREYFARLKNESMPARLTRLRDKVLLLKGSAIDRLLCLHFNRTLRSFAAEDFVKQVLIEGLQVRYLVVGDDFRFGCDRKGDFALLKSMGSQHGFEVVNLPTLQHGDERVSSSRIRELLAADEIDHANKLLGREYSISGRIIRGNQLGRQLGVPTANINIGHYTLPLAGVYAVEVEGLGKRLQGVANMGTRPTLSGDKKPILEVNIFDFNEDIYDKTINVIFRASIRREQKFESLELLREQIKKDVESAKQFFKNQ